jgi:16S rRNA (guanine1516-N2)-methyltransferase
LTDSTSRPLLEEIDGRLCLRGAEGTVCVDWVGGAMGFRRKRGGGRGQAVARAVGMKGPHSKPRVLDLTAGLGRDAFVLATLGCTVLALERQAEIFQLLKDGLRRANQDAETFEALGERLQLLQADANALLALWPAGPLADFKPDVLYLDPMHPPRKKSALPRKEMRLFRQLVGADFDQEQLLAAARATGVKRVVVKRPSSAPPLAPGVSSSISGKTTRFDVYRPQL